MIVPSARTARDLRERIGVDPGKIRVIPMGVGAPFAPFAPFTPFTSTRSAAPGDQAAREDRSGAPVLVYVGGFDPSKNVPLLFEMLARLSDRRVRLAIAGDPGASRATLVDAALRAGIGERIEWLGRLGEEELAAVYRRADLFVTASRHEGFGLPALEAMASGCPVVALRSGPVPEVLEARASAWRERIRTTSPGRSGGSSGIRCSATI